MVDSSHNILITGASRGIGKALLTTLATPHHYVVGTATGTTGCEHIETELQAHQASGSSHILDVAQPEQITALYQTLQAQNRMPHVLIHNAGITDDQLIVRMKPEQWHRVIQTNLDSAFYLCQGAIKAMIKARWGRIILISSVVAVQGNPGQANYCASKAGLIGLARSLAQEWASRQITVNVIAPGFIDSDMTRALPESQRQALLQRIPAQRMGTPEEIATLAVYLASPAAGYITGQVFHVNGGLWMG